MCFAVEFFIENFKIGSGALIKIKNLNKTYTSANSSFQALKNINLSIARGDIFGVIGPSGAGKSSLIRCVNLLEKPTSGDIFIDGENITKMQAKQLRQARHKIGMIFQHFNLLNSRKVFDNIALPLELMKFDKKVIKAKVEPLLELTDLTDKKHNYPSELSGGQKQRVAIARALATDPKILLSDEATSSLDPQTTLSILNLLKNINKELGLTILLITHEMEVVKNICNRLALISKSEIIETSSVGDFFVSPQTQIGKNFVQGILNKPLPQMLREKLTKNQSSGNPVLRLTFSDQAVKEPLISSLVLKYNIHISILQAQIEAIGDKTLGQLVVELQGDEAKTKAALDFLHKAPVTIEILGFSQ